MNRQEVVEVMRYGSRSEKMNYLNDLDTVFDTYNRNVTNSNEVIDALIDFAVASEDDELTNEILEVICSAQISQDLKNINYNKIAKNIKNIPEKFLPRCIDILGNTGDISYVPVIMSFKNNSNRNVLEAVRNALTELRTSGYN